MSSARQLKPHWYPTVWHVTGCHEGPQHPPGEHKGTHRHAPNRQEHGDLVKVRAWGMAMGIGIGAGMVTGRGGGAQQLIWGMGMGMGIGMGAE